MFICSLWAPSKSHQLSTLTKTSCYWCQTCQDAAAAEEGTASCSDGAPSAQFAVTQTGLFLSQKKKKKKEWEKPQTNSIGIRITHNYGSRECYYYLGFTQSHLWLCLGSGYLSRNAHAEHTGTHLHVDTPLSRSTKMQTFTHQQVSRQGIDTIVNKLSSSFQAWHWILCFVSRQTQRSSSLFLPVDRASSAWQSLAWPWGTGWRKTAELPSEIPLTQAYKLGGPQTGERVCLKATKMYLTHCKNFREVFARHHPAQPSPPHSLPRLNEDTGLTGKVIVCYPPAHSFIRYTLGRTW